MAPRGSRDDEGVIDPEDLDITNNEQVQELREGQYVIATGEDETDFASLRADIRAEMELDSEDEPPGEQSASAADPRAALVDHLESLSTANGFVIAGRFDGEVHVNESASDDPGAVFGDLLTWYAKNVDSDTPPQEVLGILCLAGEVPIRFPTRTLVEFLSAHNLSPNDSISDLVDVIRDDGLVLPLGDESLE